MAKRLYRSRDIRMVSGVAGGLSEYFDVDPVIIRALFVIITLGGGTGLIAYIILWIIVPLRPYNINGTKNPYNDNAANFTHSSDDEPENIYENYASDPNYKPYNKYTESETEDNNNSKIFFGGLLIFTGLLFLLDNVIHILNFSIIWPILLVALGAYILYQTISKNKKGEENEII
jgi:phage shock protein C